MKTMDDNEADSHPSYAFTEVPSSVMAEHTDEWKEEKIYLGKKL